MRSSGPRIRVQSPRPADSVRTNTHSVHLSVRPWSPQSPGFLRGDSSARTAARRRPVATSVAALRRRRSTELCPRVSRAGSPDGTAPSGPCRAPSRRSSAAISSAASSASHFGRAICTGCGQGFVVAFSCKGRGVCPSCNARHMTQTAAHLADHVIPPVPVRQWVISVPKRRRSRWRRRHPLSGAGCDPRMEGNCERGRGLRRQRKSGLEHGYLERGEEVPRHFRARVASSPTSPGRRLPKCHWPTYPLDTRPLLWCS